MILNMIKPTTKQALSALRSEFGFASVVASWDYNHNKGSGM